MLASWTKQTGDRNHGSDPGSTQALSIGQYATISGPAFDYRGCGNLR